MPAGTAAAAGAATAAGTTQAAAAIILSLSGTARLCTATARRVASWACEVCCCIAAAAHSALVQLARWTAVTLASDKLLCTRHHQVDFSVAIWESWRLSLVLCCAVLFVHLGGLHVGLLWYCMWTFVVHQTCVGSISNSSRTCGCRAATVPCCCLLLRQQRSLGASSFACTLHCCCVMCCAVSSDLMLLCFSTWCVNEAA